MRFLVVLLLVSGCAGSVPAVVPCPEIISYDLATQKQAAAELRSLPPGNVLGIMMTDYGQMRAACRVKP